MRFNEDATEPPPEKLSGGKDMKVKSIIIILILFIVLNLVNVSAQDNLVVEYHFDEGNGIIASDSSGNSNDGTIYGAIWVIGISGSALSFDGAGDYVEITSLDSLSFSTGSVSLWFKPTNGFSAGVAHEDLFSKEGPDSESDSLEIYLNGDIGKLAVDFGDGGTQNRVQIYSDLNSWNDEWYNVVLTWDYSGVKLYINGESQSDYSTIMKSVGPYQTQVGAVRGEHSFNGKIDDVRIDDRAFSAIEIQSNYQDMFLLYEPSAPRNLLTTTADSRIMLSWTAPILDGGSPIISYNIYRGTTSGGETYLTTVEDLKSYTDISLMNGQNYYYKVSAVNDVGEGAMSSEASATPNPGNNPPNAYFTISSTSGNTSTLFVFDASDSSDDIDLSSELEVRWDLTNDEEWDTNFTTSKTLAYQYAIEGMYEIALEVQDSEGSSSIYYNQIVVIDQQVQRPPDWDILNIVIGIVSVTLAFIGIILARVWHKQSMNKKEK